MRRGTRLVSELNYEQVPEDIAHALKKAISAVRSSPLMAAADKVVVFSKVEEDAELKSWKYAVVTIRWERRTRGKDLSPQQLQTLEDKTLQKAYSELTPDEAVKTLLVFQRV